jgi:hypothetical protein
MSDEEREVDELSSKFEAVKIAMQQDKTGHILRLSIHPSDTPEDIMRDPVGTRYLIVAVRIGDEGEMVAAPSQREGLMAVKMAAALSRDARFQTWLVQQELADVISEAAAADAIRTHCAIKSRSNLKTDPTARRRFLALRNDFANDLRRGIIPKG